VVGKTAGASQGALSWVAPLNVIAANSVHYDLVSITVTLSSKYCQPWAARAD
jgi:hypothetical protein